MKSSNSGVYACDTFKGGFASLPSKSLLQISPLSSMTILYIIMHVFIISASVSSVRPEKFHFLEKWQNRNFDYKIVILVKNP